MPMIEITSSLSIPDHELAFETSRSGGPGGQNVNKVETRVAVRFDVARSPSLSGWQRERLLARLASRITRDGVLIVASQRHRTQPANRAAAVTRLAELLRDALKRQPVRKKTRPSRAAGARRLDVKKRRGLTKKLRTKTILWDE